MPKKPTPATPENCPKSENVNILHIGTPWNNLIASIEDLLERAEQGEIAAIALVALIDQGPGTEVESVLSGHSCRDTADGSAGRYFYEIVGALEQVKFEVLRKA